LIRFAPRKKRKEQETCRTLRPSQALQPDCWDLNRPLKSADQANGHLPSVCCAEWHVAASASGLKSRAELSDQRGTAQQPGVTPSRGKIGWAKGLSAGLTLGLASRLAEGSVAALTPRREQPSADHQPWHARGTVRWDRGKRGNREGGPAAAQRDGKHH
jgi:hypothetical protein